MQYNCILIIHTPILSTDKWKVLEDLSIHTCNWSIQSRILDGNMVVHNNLCPPLKKWVQIIPLPAPLIQNPYPRSQGL